MGSNVARFAEPAPPEVLEQVAVRLRERNVEATIVSDASQARDAVLQRLPAGVEVHSGKSKTLQDIGVTPELAEGGQYNYLRNAYLKMDRNTQMREIRKLIAAPDFMLGSVSAVTQDGILVAGSATASQLGPYASGGGKVILVVGSQKIVPDLDSATYPRIRVAMGRRPGAGHGADRILCRQDSDDRAGMGNRENRRDPGTTAGRDLGGIRFLP